MNGVFLRLYVHENRKHGHVLLYEWLLEQAKRLGIQGGSAFRAIAGYGRHGVLHEEHFFELAGDLPVEVEFVLTEAQCADLVALLARENVNLLYVKTPVEFGVAGGAPAAGAAT